MRGVLRWVSWLFGPILRDGGIWRGRRGKASVSSRETEEGKGPLTAVEQSEQKRSSECRYCANKQAERLLTWGDWGLLNQVTSLSVAV